MSYSITLTEVFQELRQYAEATGDQKAMAGIQRLTAELEHVLDVSLNPLVILRFVRVDGLISDDDLISTPESAEGLTHWLYLIAANLDRYPNLWELKRAVEAAKPPTNEHNYFTDLVSAGLLSWQIEEYNPAIHGTDSAGKPKRQLQGKELIRVVFLKPELLKPFTLGGRPPEVCYQADSQMGQLLQVLLEHNGEWVPLSELMERTDLPREKVFTIHQLNATPHRRPNPFWPPINVESHKPHRAQMATHIRVKPVSELVRLFKQMQRDEE